MNTQTVKFGKITVQPSWVVGWNSLELSLSFDGRKFRVTVTPDWVQAKLNRNGYEPGFALQSAFLCAVLRKIGYTGEIPYERFEGVLFPMDVKNLVTTSDATTTITAAELETGLKEYQTPVIGKPQAVKELK